MFLMLGLYNGILISHPSLLILFLSKMFVPTLFWPLLIAITWPVTLVRSRYVTLMMSPDLKPDEVSTNALLLPVGSYFWRSCLCKNEMAPWPFLFFGSGSKTGFDAETMVLTLQKTPRAVTGAVSLTKLTSPNMVGESKNWFG